MSLDLDSGIYICRRRSLKRSLSCVGLDRFASARSEFLMLWKHVDGDPGEVRLSFSLPFSSVKIKISVFSINYWIAVNTLKR